MEWWILKYLTLFFGFYMAWNIGANDVANAMGTSVGSRALTLKKAVVLAAILEFCGAFFVGSHVSHTLQSNIVSPAVFAQEPMIFALGMIGALLSTAIWLQGASFFKLPVSTTHSIVGAILGFGMIMGGLHAIHWIEIVQIVLSWLISPILSGAVSYLLFRLIQNTILFSPHPVQATKKLTPIFVFFCFLVITLSVVFDGLKNLHLHLSFPMALFYAIIVGCVFSIISIFLVRKIPSFHMDVAFFRTPQELISLEKAFKHLQRVQLQAKETTKKKLSLIMQEIQVLKEHTEENQRLFEKSSPFVSVEKIFVFLQIISASLVAFAHGANDVANAIGPVAAVIDVLHTKVVPVYAKVPIWLLALGGAGIVFGLATWGWRVIETIGHKITELTPTRGFSAEFGSALTILLASKLGLPISTTHCLVGSVLGVGLARGLYGLNLKTLRDIIVSWIVTIPICALLSIIVFYILRIIFST
jgi:PiT family inorganic phosphate transporter